MTRYHRSFIGLMEQNKEGEWVRHDEALERLRRVYDSYDEAVIGLQSEIDAEKSENDLLRWILAALLVLSTIKEVVVAMVG